MSTENISQLGGCGCGAKSKNQPAAQPTTQTSIISRVFVSKEVQQSRMNLCKECEHFESLLIRCKICGCFLEAKTRLSGFHCALDQIGETPKW